MLIEAVGISGAGKSTIINALKSELRRRGAKVRYLHKLCDTSRVLEETYWKVAISDAERDERQRLLSFWNFCNDHPELALNLRKAILALPRHQSDCAYNMAMLDQLSRLKHHHIAVLVDEGLLNRAVAAHALEASDLPFQSFLKHAIFPEVLLWIDLDLGLAEDRALAHVPLRKRPGVLAERQAFQDPAKQTAMLVRLSNAARAAGSLVVKVDGARPVEENAVAIASAIQHGNTPLEFRQIA